MANEEQLSILKQGVQVWNKWREEHPDTAIDFYEADLEKASLRFANLRKVNLTRAKLAGADLAGADLTQANLSDVNLTGAFVRGGRLKGAYLVRAQLKEATLVEAHFWLANLTQANLTAADLSGAQLVETILNEVIFRDTNLSMANLTGALLSGSDFSSAKMRAAAFGNSDLSNLTGLDDIVHYGPSNISTSVFRLSKGKISEVFLRGCGLSDWEIEEVKLYNPDLSNDERNRILYKIYDLQTTRAIQISPLFISYSHGDSKFVDLIDKHLTELGIRFWRDIHDLKAGKIEKQIDQAISQDRIVFLVLSEQSLKSDWVEHEVRTARQLEKDMNRDVLCPIALDDSWKDSSWPARIMEQIMEYNILDFSEWKDDVKFDGMFRKLIDGLQLFYKG